jgi:hypothetical protein|tara:strand:- start:1261 stop:2016 length:756 start_codon:yes stop_codon:yes gene_type:complete|mmetsp:Transcript_7268/g.32753  ORF Transcript_7268/g.32753 Transcript_7268/m.32753 type:complete len:252 (-) Transcript_7268:81-836(-)
MAWLSNVLVYTGGYLFLVFIAVCLATGLYYLAEIVEEYTRVTKKVLTWAIKISVGMNVALLVIDRLPFLCILISCAAQGAYWTLLKRFPFMELASPEFLGSVGALILNHFMWMRHFKHDDHHDDHYGRYNDGHSVEYLLGFFLMVVWIVPFGFFISLAANESVLPGGGGVGLKGSGASSDGLNAGGGGSFNVGAAYGTLDGGMGGGRRKRANVVLQVLDFGKAQWDKFTKKNLPGVIPGGLYTGSYKERTF